MAGLEICGVVMSGISFLSDNNRANAAVSRKCKDLFNPKRKMAELRIVKDSLVTLETDIKQNLETEVCPGKKAKETLLTWLKRVDDLKKKIDEEIEMQVGKPKSWGQKLSPNCCLRLKLGKNITSLIDSARTLIVEGQTLSGAPLAVTLHVNGLNKPTSYLFGETTARRTMDDVWRGLMDDENWIIGVWGMGGVGKTTMMENIQNRLVDEKHHFDKIIWVTVSREINISNIQKEIADQIRLDFAGCVDETRRASMLFTALSRMKSFVLILDDMWEEIQKERIGIPDFSKDYRRKLVLTTRSHKVCSSMLCTKKVKILTLSEVEAWQLFIKTVGVTLDPDVELVAREVAKECSELPLAIITVGKAMRGRKELELWRAAQSELETYTEELRGSTHNDSTLMEKEVIGRLKFSYQKLENDTYRDCFLCCALYPEDYPIDSAELIDHWIMEGLVPGKGIEDELDQGRRILIGLNDSCLLQGISRYGASDEYVKMHDLVRDMALHVTKTLPRFMVKAGRQFVKLLADDLQKEDLVKVSLMKCGIIELSTSPKWQELRILLLSHNPLERIANEFFVHMRNLKVLNLGENSCITVLPESISELVNLYVLILTGCVMLTKIPSVMKLRSLRVLKADRTSIRELPDGMKFLDKLERLHLSDTKLQESPDAMLLNFQELKELHMLPLIVSDDCVHVLLKLRCLNSLSVKFSSISQLVNYIRSSDFRKLDYFTFVVGDYHMWSSLPSRSKSVTLMCSHIGSDKSYQDDLLLPPNSTHLEIIQFNSLTRFTDLKCLKDTKRLKTCKIEDCEDMEYIVCAEQDQTREAVLQKMEEIEIEDCHKLLSLYHGKPAPGDLSCLRKLTYRACESLKYMFSITLLKQLNQLEEIEIRDCGALEQLLDTSSESHEESQWTSSVRKLVLRNLHNLRTSFSKRMLAYFQNLEEMKIFKCMSMEEIIAEDEAVDEASDDDKTITLPLLKTLELGSLNKLKSIWEGVFLCDSLENIKVQDCDQLKKLPLLSGKEQTPPRFLTEIKGSIKWRDSLHWDNIHSATLLFLPLFPNDEKIIIPAAAPAPAPASASASASAPATVAAVAAPAPLAAAATTDRKGKGNATLFLAHELSLTSHGENNKMLIGDDVDVSINRAPPPKGTDVFDFSKAIKRKANRVRLTFPDTITSTSGPEPQIEHEVGQEIMLVREGDSTSFKTPGVANIFLPNDMDMCLKKSEFEILEDLCKHLGSAIAKSNDLRHLSKLRAASIISDTIESKKLQEELRETRKMLEDKETMLKEVNATVQILREEADQREKNYAVELERIKVAATKDVHAWQSCYNELKETVQGYLDSGVLVLGDVEEPLIVDEVMENHLA